MQVKISLHPYDITNSNFKSQQKPLNDFIMYVLRHELGTGGWTEPVEEHKATIHFREKYGMTFQWKVDFNVYNSRFLVSATFDDSLWTLIHMLPAESIRNKVPAWRLV